MLDREISSVFKKVDGYDRETIASSYLEAKLFRNILRKVIEAKLEELFVTKNTDYEKDAWAYYQAHKNGKIQAFRELIQIL